MSSPIARQWGVLALVADGRNPITVVLAQDGQSGAAGPPGSREPNALTLDQVESVVLDALTSGGRPSWHQLT